MNGKTGDDLDTMYGVEQGDPLSTDLFGVLIEILYEMMRVICPDVGVELGCQKVPCSFSVDDLKILLSPEQMQRSINVLDTSCDMFYFTVNSTNKD